MNATRRSSKPSFSAGGRWMPRLSRPRTRTHFCCEELWVAALSAAGGPGEAPHHGQDGRWRRLEPDEADTHDEGGAAQGDAASGQARSAEEGDVEERRRSQGGAKASGRGGRPAWRDPGDDKLEINVAGHARLRKLRETEKQTVLNGESVVGQSFDDISPRLKSSTVTCVTIGHSKGCSMRRHSESATP